MSNGVTTVTVDLDTIENFKTIIEYRSIGTGKLKEMCKASYL